MQSRRRVIVISLFWAFGFFAPVGAPAAEIEGFELKGDRWTFRDGTRSIEGVLLKPEGEGPFPALVISHGLGGTAENICRQIGRELVKMGFVCIAPNYTHNAAAAMQARRPGGNAGGERPAAGVGRPQPDYGASPENIARGLKCVEILESLPFVDAKRIGAYGHSMGAFLTIALAAEAPGRIRSAAITAGGLSGRAGFPAPTKEVAAKVRTPFLILHGTADTTVRPEQSEELKKALDENKVPNERHVFEGVNHDINRVRAEDCYRLMREWFTRHGLLADTSAKPRSP